MKKLTLTLILLSTVFKVQSQDAINIASKEICDCTTSKLEFIYDVQNEQKDAFLYICTTDVFNNNTSAILKAYGLSTQLEGTFERFTKDVNVYLSNNCQNVLPKKTEQLIEPTGQNENNDTTKVEGVVECTVLNIANYQYPTIEAKDKNGVIQSFIIYKSFSTDILFTAGGIKVGNNIKVSYEIQDIYDSNAKAFKSFKVVTQLEKRR